MAFELIVSLPPDTSDLVPRLESQLQQTGIVAEIYPSFDLATWGGGCVPIRLCSLPTRYLFGLAQVEQIVAIEFYRGNCEVTLRTAMGRTIAELILQCHLAAALAVITGGKLFDPQEGEEFTGQAAVNRADFEIARYELDVAARVQHRFTRWEDYD